MTDQEQPALDHGGRQPDAQAHPERAVDELEEQVLGRRMDQARDEGADTRPAVDQDRDEPTPAVEQP